METIMNHLIFYPNPDTSICNMQTLIRIPSRAHMNVNKTEEMD